MPCWERPTQLDSTQLTGSWVESGRTLWTLLQLNWKSLSFSTVAEFWTFSELVELSWVGRSEFWQLNSTENVQNCNNSQTSWVELSLVVKSIQSARPDSTQPVELSWVASGAPNRALDVLKFHN